MFATSLRAVLGSAALAAFGLSPKPEFITPALAGTFVEPRAGFYKYKVGDIDVTAIYDGIWAGEYLGELYVEAGDMARAEEQVSVLRQLCPGGCEELEGLQEAIAAKTDN